MKIIFISLICFIALIRPASAISEFSTSYAFLYEVKESGVTNVTQNISLTNLTTAYYPAKYTINLNSEKISNISASQNSQPLKVNLIRGKNFTKAEVLLESKSVGLKKTLNLNLNYQSTEIAQQKGRIWEIKIPAAQNQAFEDYQVKLILPKSFGSPSYLNPQPQPKVETQNFASLQYAWKNENNPQNGITVAFGDSQAYQFSSTFLLKNSSFWPRVKTLSLPVSNSSQKINIISLEPKPLKDNYYFLWPFQTLKIKVNGYAKVFKYPFGIAGLPKDTQLIYITN